jgi:hypothetical protein
LERETFERHPSPLGRQALNRARFPILCLELPGGFGILCQHPEIASSEQKRLLLALRCQQGLQTQKPLGFQRPTIMALAWFQRLERKPPSSHPLLTKIPGCVFGYRPCIDILHTLDLGVSQRLCGSVLHTWCYQEACDKAMAAKNMRQTWNQIQDKYKSMKVSEKSTNIFLSQFSQQC